MSYIILDPYILYLLFYILFYIICSWGSNSHFLFMVNCLFIYFCNYVL